MQPLAPKSSHPAYELTYTGFEAELGASLGDWEPLVGQWQAVIERAVDRCQWMDAPFVHAEHGNMHALMVGAEMAGWTTMREMIGNRDDAQGPLGRLDGCFIGQTSVDLVEAKAKEFPIQPGGQLLGGDFNECRKFMDDALRDSMRYFNRHDLFKPFPLPKRRVGVAFFYGYFKGSSGVDAHCLPAYLAKLRTIEHDVMAWTFPGEARGLRYHGDRVYPGVVMLGKIAGEEPAAVLPAAK